MSATTLSQPQELRERVSPDSRVAVLGGGLAGLSAACALAELGLKVTLFERRPFLGGRASSYQHPGTGEVVDNCQHVLLGCCTNLVDFYRRTGVEKKIQWSDRLTFIEPGGRRSTLRPSPLPAPFHSAPGFLASRSLSLADKLAIARAMLAIARMPRIPDKLSETSESFLEWLQRNRQTARAIDRFWKVVLISALNETLDRISVPYAAQVFRESFLNSAAAGAIGLPAVPLTELYAASAEYIQERGGKIHLRASVEALTAEPDCVVVQWSGAGRREWGAASLASRDSFDFVISALTFDAVARILPKDAANDLDAGSSLRQSPNAAELAEQLACFESSPITGIHLWFDREITDLDHAVLLDRTIQWMFNKSQIHSKMYSKTHPEKESPAAGETEAGGPGAHESQYFGEDPEQRENGRLHDSDDEARQAESVAKAGGREAAANHIELVVSASRSLVEKSRTEILDMALKETAEFFPRVAEAKLLKATVIKEIRATYSVLPQSDLYRPGVESPWPRIFLAGDWTATGWPATMEGAARSGHKAAEAVARAAGRSATFIAPDLPPAGFMRWFK